MYNIFKLKKTINISFLFILTISFSQNKATYEKTLSEIKNSSKILCTNLIIPNSEFSVGIYTDGWEVEDLTEEQCGDIKTNSNKNLKILKLLESEGLLNSLYLDIGNKKYEKIESNEEFEWSKTILVIELNFVTKLNGTDQVYIPISTKKKAKELINSFNDIFNSKYCFRKLKKKL